MSLLTHLRLNGDHRDEFGNMSFTPSNVMYEDGKLGLAMKGVSFGEEYSGELTSTSNAKLPECLAIAFWIWPPFGQVLNWRNIIGKAVNDQNNEIKFRYSANGTDVQFYYGDGTNLNIVTLNRENLIPSNKWTHLVLIRDSKEKRLKIYKNGNLFSSVVTTLEVGYSDRPLKITNVYDQKLQDVRIYDHHLSEKEIKDLARGKTFDFDFSNGHDYRYGNKGTDYNCTLTDQGMLFAGDGSYIDLGADNRFVNRGDGQPFTLEAVVTPNGFDDRDMLFSINNGRSGSPWTCMFGLINGIMNAYNGTAWVAIGTTLTVGVETHIAWVYDGTTLHAYKDGLLVGSAAFTYSIKDGSTVKVGGHTNTVDFNGYVRKLTMFSTALSPDEIMERYRQKASLDDRGNMNIIKAHDPVAFHHTWENGNPKGSSYTWYGAQLLHGPGEKFRFLSTITDPRFEMKNIGSFDPSIYKYFQFRYRVISQNYTNNAQIYFHNAQYLGATTPIYRTAILNSDGEWHVASVDMSTHPNWLDSNITGFRFDPCNALDVEMEVDWIRLVSTDQSMSVGEELQGSFSEIGITDGLIGYYPFKKDAKDYSGNGNHGSTFGVVHTSGIGRHGAYQISGDGSVAKHIDTGDTLITPAKLDVEFSISAFVKATKFTSESWVLSQYVQSDLSRFIVLIDTSGRPTYFHGGSVARDSTALTLNEYHHLAFTRDVDGHVSVYVNGAFKGSATINKEFLDLPTKIGNSYFSSYQPDFSIAGLKIFNRVLTPEEVGIEYKTTKDTALSQYGGRNYLQGELIESK